VSGIRVARFPQSKNRNTFDFNVQPSLNKALVLELARCEWIEKRQNRTPAHPAPVRPTSASH
jgi:DNA replication protein DnaC